MQCQVYTDIGISGTKEEIKKIDQHSSMMQDVDRDKITAVYVIEQSRLGYVINGMAKSFYIKSTKSVKFI
jgi:hypothetical protein